MIQIDMEMPDSCRECWFLKYDMYSGETSCAIEDMILARYFKALDFEGRHEECPLVDVPDINVGKCSEFPNSSDGEYDPRPDIYYLAEKIGIHRLYALVVQLRGEPESCIDTISRQMAIDETRKCRFVVDAIEKIRGLPSVQPELIEKTAYIRGFEQGRTQGMIDSKAKEVAQPEADLQSTCNQLATERYEDLCEYFGDQRDPILTDRIEFKRWLDRVRWHVKKVDELTKRSEDEWCTDCKEYDNEKHNCPRFNRVIRETVKEIKPERKSVIYYLDRHSDGRMVAECPSCGYIYDKDDNVWGEPFCPHCGQELKW